MTLSRSLQAVMVSAVTLSLLLATQAFAKP